MCAMSVHKTLLLGDVTHKWHNSFMHVTWLMHVWRDSLIRVTWLVWHDSFICVKCFMYVLTRWRGRPCRNFPKVSSIVISYSTLSSELTFGKFHKVVSRQHPLLPHSATLPRSPPPSPLCSRHTLWNLSRSYQKVARVCGGGWYARTSVLFSMCSMCSTSLSRITTPLSTPVSRGCEPREVLLRRVEV